MPNPKGHEDSIKDSRFKAAWQSGPTRTIRVPITLADATLEYARQLDLGVEPRDTGERTDIEAATSVIEPRDTGERTDIEAATSVIEPRDTSKFQSELEKAKADYCELLESSTVVTQRLAWEVQELRKWLAIEKTRSEGLWEKWGVTKQACADLRLINSDLKEKLAAALTENKKSAPADKDFPDAADLLNQLKARRKKSKADLADLEAILEILDS